MKINKIEIYGYGKWVDQSFDIDNQLQMIYGANEAGKSTLQSFIRSILFGFPSKRRRVNQVNRFEPKDSPKYGGRILLSDTIYGQVWVERTAKGLAIQKINGEILDPTALDRMLAGLDEKLFDTFYAFSLKNLQEIANLDADQVNDYFLSIGTYGSDTFVRVARQLEKEANEMYRPQGQNPPINQALNQLKQLEERVQAAEQQAEVYDTLLAERDKESNIIDNMTSEIQNLEHDLREMDKLVTRYDIFLKHAAASRELEGLVYTPINNGDPETLAAAKKEIDENRVEISNLKEKISRMQGELGTMTRLNWAINHEEQRNQWLVITQTAKDTQSKIEYLQGRIDEQKSLMKDLANRGNFDPDKLVDPDKSQAQFDIGLQHQADKIDLEKQAEAIQSELKIYKSQRMDQQNYSATVRSQRAKLENQRLNEEALLVEQTSLKHYFLGGAFMIVGLFVGLGTQVGLLGSSTWMFILGLIMLFIGISSVAYVVVVHRNKIKAYYQSPIINKIQELKDRETTYLEQAKEVSLKINGREQDLSLIEHSLKEVKQRQMEWLVGMGYSANADPQTVLATNPGKAYYQAKLALDGFQSEKDSLDLQQAEWREKLQPLFERFPYHETNIRLLIRYVEELEAQLKVTQFRGQTIQEKINEDQVTIDELSKKIEDNQTLIQNILAKVGAENELEFVNKQRINEQIDDLQMKVQVYQDQLIDYVDQLAQVENKQALTEEAKRLEIHIQNLKDRLEPHRHQRANLEVQIRFLEQDGTYQTLRQEYMDTRESVKDLVIQWASKRLAMSLIQETLKKGIEDPLPKMLSIANELFEKLSSGRYNKIIMQDQDVRVLQFSGISFHPHELSQGTLEQLYVALRLAFIETAHHMVKLPILIDDAFVNFDELRKEAIYQVLDDFAKDHQVLFFTFDSHAKKVFANKSIINLEQVSEEDLDVI